jgi:protein arginine N-methyltransferase 7
VLLDELPQKANVLISEIFDSELLGENVLRTFEHALQTLTTPNVICIPERANVYVVPIESRLLAQQCQLPSTFKTNCNGNLSGIDSHWLTSGNKTFDSVCKPILLKR